MIRTIALDKRGRETHSGHLAWRRRVKQSIPRIIRLAFDSLRSHLDPSWKLDPRTRLEVAQLQLKDLVSRTPYWLAVLAVSCIAVWAFAVRDPAKSVWPMKLWMLSIVACVLSYPFIIYWINRLPAKISLFQIKRAQLIWCGWLTVIAAIWLSGNEVIAPQPKPYGVTFVLGQQTFVYITILAQFITVMCFSPSVVAIFSVIAIANLLPFEFHIIYDLKKNNDLLSLENTHVFFSGQLVVFLLVGWFFSASQKGFYIRQVLLRHERIHSETERARAEAERLRANNFITAVGHDLKQPLQATALRLRALKNKAADIPDIKDMVDELERQNASLHEMVDASFDLSRLNAGTWNLEIRESVLSNIVMNVWDEFRFSAAQKGLKLEVEPIPEVLVRTDPDALGRILRNLLGNAIKYTPAHAGGETGRISITCQLDDALVAISVRDNGIGIPADRADDIFEPYVQLTNPSRDRAKGFGLGLSIVNGLIHLLDGHSLSLDRPNGRGSQFTVHVPFIARIPDELLQNDEDDAKPDLAGMRVAVLEDSEAVRDALCEQLQELGCCVYEGATADEVIRTMEDSGDGVSRPDFIIADYRLAEGIGSGAHTGVEAIKTLRARFGNNIPAVIWTAESEPELLQSIVVIGGLEVLSKGPRTFDELLNILKRVHQKSSTSNNEAA